MLIWAIFYALIVHLILVKETISLEWILFITAFCLCLFIIYFVFIKAWRHRRHEQHESKEPCLHGIPGGKTRDRCVVCVREHEEENSRREQKEQEHQKLQRIKETADALRHEEFKRLAKDRVSRIDFLMSGTPRQFEDTVATMFEKLGYSVKQTPYSNDRGRDAIATKGGKKVLIECKRYEENNLVGRPALQKFYAAIMEDKADKGFFVTTSRFTRTALEYDYVQSNIIELIDGEILANMMIRAFPNSNDAERYKVICLQCGCEVIFDLLAGETEKPCHNNHIVNNDLHLEMLSLKLVSDKLYCKKCGREMRRVHGRRGDFWGCTGYPGCRFICSIK